MCEMTEADWDVWEETRNQADLARETTADLDLARQHAPEGWMVVLRCSHCGEIEPFLRVYETPGAAESALANIPGGSLQLGIATLEAVLATGCLGAAELQHLGL